ncbi:hypothetical protein XELAEV_18033653mg, partial [Xenopus laevis]
VNECEQAFSSNVPATALPAISRPPTNRKQHRQTWLMAVRERDRSAPCDPQGSTRVDTIIVKGAVLTQTHVCAERRGYPETVISEARSKINTAREQQECHQNCNQCPCVHKGKDFIHSETGYVAHLRGFYTCVSKYCETTQMIKSRISQHRSAIHLGNMSQPVSKHFLEKGHSADQLRFMVLEMIPPLRNGGDRELLLKQREVWWIHKLGSYVFSLSTKGSKLKIRSQDKYNYGKWHMVIFSWNGLSGRLVVDGLKERKGTLTKYFGLEKIMSVRLRGVLSHKIQSVPKKSFSGCLKNLKLNGLALDRPSHTFAVTPCYDGSFQKGIFFALYGGHVVIDNSINLNMDFKMSLNIRPQSQSGVLFHTSTKWQQLSLYMEAGELILSADNGSGAVLVSVTPQRTLCDGKWHIIKASRKQNDVQLEVDKQSKQSVVPSSLTHSNPDARLLFCCLPNALVVPQLPVKTPKMSTFSGA